MTRSRTAAQLFLCLLVTSCAQAPDRPAKADVSPATTIAVISMAADYARLGSIGTTVFGNEHYYAPLGQWPFDAEIEAEIMKSSQAVGPKLVQVSYDRSALFRAYNTRDVDAPMSQRPLSVRGDLQLVRAELAAIAERAGAQRLLIVTKAICPDSIGATNQPLNGFGVRFGRVQPESAFALGPGTWRSATHAYLCADIVLFDPAKGETLASQRVMSDKRAIPTYVLSGFSKSLSDIPEAWRNEILAAFRSFVPVAGSSAREFLKGAAS